MANYPVFPKVVPFVAPLSWKDFKYSTNGNPYLKGTIYFRTGGKDERGEKIDFKMSIVAFGKTAEFIHERLADKGHALWHLEMQPSRAYEKDGEMVGTNEFKVERCQPATPGDWAGSAREEPVDMLPEEDDIPF